MSKISKILSLIFLLSFGLLFYFPQKASAAICNITSYDATDPNTPPNQNMNNLRVTITSGDFAPTSEFRTVLKRPNGGSDDTYVSAHLKFDSQNSITVEYKKPQIGGWEKGTYQFYFIKWGNDPGDKLQNADCKQTIIIGNEISQQHCTSAIPTHPIEPGTNVILHVEGIAANQRSSPDLLGTGGYDIIVNGKFNQVYSTDSGQDISLGSSFDVGTYLVEVKNRCGFVGTGCSGPPRLQCNAIGFKVTTKGSGGGGQISPDEVSQNPRCKNPGDPSIVSGDSICTTSQAHNTGCTNNAISTAIGCIHTDPTGFTKDFLTFIIGISGGLAFLMMLLGAFQMLTSAGNPETLNAGKDRLTSAIIGLLFIIFAILLLQIIGVGILALPEFLSK